MKDNKKCLNCGEPLDNDQNYCPNCGQENSDKKLPIVAFLKDFFSNTLSFDTILIKTINPFLFRPGKLTQAFNEGKRRRYINPIRLYLIFSLFYFFMIGITVPKDFIDQTIENSLENDEPLDSVALTKLNDKELETFIQAAQDSSKSTEKKGQWAKIKSSANDLTVNDDEFKAYIEAFFGLSTDTFDTVNLRKFIANSSIFIYQATRNLPLMMFFFLPIFAGILKLLFFKRRYYVEHLIHALHLHSFAYFIYGLAILLISLFNFINGWLIFLSFLWVSGYALFSIKRLYKNGWGKSILKFFILGTLYASLLIFGFLLELYISFISL